MNERINEVVETPGGSGILLLVVCRLIAYIYLLAAGTMKQSKTTIILTIIIALVLFVFSFYTFGDVFDAMLPEVDNGRYQVTEINGVFKEALIFSLVLGLMPVFIVTTWRFSPIILKSRRVASIAIVVVFMVLAIMVRQQRIKSYFNNFANLNSPGSKINVSFPADELYFEYYLLGGLCVGCFISFIIFRDKKP